jgi:hypothetical protein
MGWEFIYRVKPSLRKSWDRGRTRLSQHDLTRTAATETRTITVKPKPGCTLGPSDTYELRQGDDGLNVYRSGELVGQGSAPPESVTSKIKEQGGVAHGTLHETKPHSGLAEIAICLDSPSKDE